MTTKPYVAANPSLSVAANTPNQIFYTVPDGQEGSVDFYISNASADTILLQLNLGGCPILDEVSIGAHSFLRIPGVKVMSGETLNANASALGITIGAAVMLRTIPT